MKARIFALSTTLLCLFAASVLTAGEVEITKSHLCCGKCVKAANGSLKNIEGVTAVTVDKSHGRVTFKATNAKVAKAGINAYAAAGLAGKATHAGKAIAFPTMGAKKGVKSNRISFGGVHLCCGKCLKAAKNAFGGVKGCKAVAVDKKAGTVTLEGKGIDQVSAQKALLAAGFFGKIK